MVIKCHRCPFLETSTSQFMTPNQLVLLIIAMIIAFVWLATRKPIGRQLN